MSDRDLQIERYLQGEMSEAEKVQFEQLIAQDPELGEEVSFQLGVQKALWNEDENSFRSELNRLEKDQKANLQRRRLWMAAASIALLACIAGLWLFLPKDQNELFQAYFSPQPNIYQPITRSAGESSTLNQGLIAYEKGDWKEALRHFSDVDKSEKPEFVILYEGNCLLALGDFSMAKQALDPLLTSQDGTLRHRAGWYWALAQLNLGQKKEAKSQLEQLTEEEGPFQERSKELIRLLP